MARRREKTVLDEEWSRRDVKGERRRGMVAGLGGGGAESTEEASVGDERTDWSSVR